MGTLKNLNLDQTFEQQEIPNGAKLVLLGQKSFTWDLNYKGSNIQVIMITELIWIIVTEQLPYSKQKVWDRLWDCARNCGFQLWSSLLGNQARHFCRDGGYFCRSSKKKRRSLHACLGLWFLLGLDLYRVSNNLTNLQTLMLMYFRGRKFCPASPGPMVQEYGGFSKINDTIGILLEFKEGVGSVSFYRNGVIL